MCKKKSQLNVLLIMCDKNSDIFLKFRKSCAEVFFSFFFPPQSLWVRNFKKREFNEKYNNSKKNKKQTLTR